MPPTDTLLSPSEIARLTAPDLDPGQGLRLLAERFAGHIVFSTSFGLEDQAVTHLIHSLNLPIRIFTLDTGRLFPETYATWTRTLEHYGLPIDVYAPDNTALQNLVSQKGPDSFYASVENRKECCHIRKVEPLQRALLGQKVWVTGIRAEQSANRQTMSALEWDPALGLFKFHPLFYWTLEELQSYPARPQVVRPTTLVHGMLDHDRALIEFRRVVGSNLQKGMRPAPFNRQQKTTHDCRSCFMNQPFDYLDHLEAQAIHILREAAGQFERPALLFSGGKDSIVLVKLAEKAFRPGKFPFPLIHIDTGHNFPEVLRFRDQLAERLGETLLVRHVEDTIRRQGLPDPGGKFPSRNALQTYTLLETIEELELDACIGGARRDEEKARAKERIFSIRDEFGQWDPKRQRPELWDLYNGHIRKGENVRVFPISNWTELDVWNYIRREKIALPYIYFAHERNCIRTPTGQLIAITEHIQLDPDDDIVVRNVRFRTVGDATCTAAVESTATTLDGIIEEITTTNISERGATRLDDRISEAAMEDRKKNGYF